MIKETAVWAESAGVCICPGDDPECSDPPMSLNGRRPGLVLDGDETTFWISEPGLTHATLTIDLGGLKELQQVGVLFAMARPHSFVLEKSVDGQVWDQYQYFSDDCSAVFRLKTNVAPSATDAPACVGLRQFGAEAGGWVRFETLASDRPGISAYRTSRSLHRWTQAGAIIAG